jgi:uncharacterized protein YjbK
MDFFLSQCKNPGRTEKDMIHEIEIKFRVISREALDELEKKANELFPNGNIKEVEQTNFFFDTADLCVRRNGIGFRLRKENENYMITLKGPSLDKKEAIASKLTSRLEFEAAVPEKDALMLLTSSLNPVDFAENLSVPEPKMRGTRDHILKIIRQACSKSEISLVGSFTNHRRILPIMIDNCAMKLEFDRTHFTRSNIQYEVELEIPSMAYSETAEAFLVDLFKQCGQTPGFERSKSERFYALLATAASLS